jgi:hypothetical protein
MAVKGVPDSPLSAGWRCHESASSCPRLRRTGMTRLAPCALHDPSVAYPIQPAVEILGGLGIFLWRVGKVLLRLRTNVVRIVILTVFVTTNKERPMKSVSSLRNMPRKRAQEGGVNAFSANGLYPPPPPVISPRCAPCSSSGGHVWRGVNLCPRRFFSIRISFLLRFIRA